MKICRKCLLQDLDKDEYINNLLEYIKNYPEEKRIDAITYQNRLSACKSCDNLSEGMCALCGCFVELRALKKNSCCPDTNKKW